MISRAGVAGGAPALKIGSPGLAPMDASHTPPPTSGVQFVVTLGLQRLAHGLRAPDTLDGGGETRLAGARASPRRSAPRACSSAAGSARPQAAGCSSAAGASASAAGCSSAAGPSASAAGCSSGTEPASTGVAASTASTASLLGDLGLRGGLLLGLRRGLLGLRLLLLGRRPAAAQLVQAREECAAMLLRGIGPLAARPARVLKALDDGDRRRLLLRDAHDLGADPRLLGVDRRRRRSLRLGGRIHGSCFLFGGCLEEPAAAPGRGPGGRGRGRLRTARGGLRRLLRGRVRLRRGLRLNRRIRRLSLGRSRLLGSCLRLGNSLRGRLRSFLGRRLRLRSGLGLRLRRLLGGRRLRLGNSLRGRLRSFLSRRLRLRSGLGLRLRRLFGGRRLRLGNSLRRGLRGRLRLGSGSLCRGRWRLGLDGWIRRARLVGGLGRGLLALLHARKGMTLAMRSTAPLV